VFQYGQNYGAFFYGVGFGCRRRERFGLVCFHLICDIHNNEKK
jgi:hypothetical protein